MEQERRGLLGELSAKNQRIVREMTPHLAQPLSKQSANSLACQMFGVCFHHQHSHPAVAGEIQEEFISLLERKKKVWCKASLTNQKASSKASFCFMVATALHLLIEAPVHLLSDDSGQLTFGAGQWGV